MKNSIAQLVNPHWESYRSVGDAALITQLLLKSSYRRFRVGGRWGSFGPTESLTGYFGCVNCTEQSWHSGRQSLRTHSEHADNLCDCILATMFEPSFAYWRKACKFDLYRQVKIPCKENRNASEMEAWQEFESLHMFKLDCWSLNSCHRGVNRLVFPQLEVAHDGIRITCEVTLLSEIKEHGGSASRWGVSFLTGNPYPLYRPMRETFAEFVLRACRHLKSQTTKMEERNLSGGSERGGEE